MWIGCSEFTGSGRVLVGAIPVNPWQQEQMVSAIHHALIMPDKERHARYDVNMEVCTAFLRHCRYLQLLLTMQAAAYSRLCSATRRHSGQSACCRI